ncbi:MAG TPA: hypothetical protein VLN45_07950 [Ignavibacteriaceae bacterium]|nr:hypothetical protein [Ignavibacteriaceae bacterium]
MLNEIKKITAGLFFFLILVSASSNLAQDNSLKPDTTDYPQDSTIIPDTTTYPDTLINPDSLKYNKQSSAKIESYCYVKLSYFDFQDSLISLRNISNRKHKWFLRI